MTFLPDAKERAEMATLLNQTNLGAHPLMWKFISAVGKGLGESKIRGKNSGREKSAAEVLYPGMN